MTNKRNGNSPYIKGNKIMATQTGAFQIHILLKAFFR